MVALQGAVGCIYTMVHVFGEALIHQDPLDDLEKHARRLRLGADQIYGAIMVYKDFVKILNIRRKTFDSKWGYAQF